MDKKNKSTVPFEFSLVQDDIVKANLNFNISLTRFDHLIFTEMCKISKNINFLNVSLHLQNLGFF